MCRSLEIHFLKTSQNHVAIFKTNFRPGRRGRRRARKNDDDGDEERVQEVKGGGWRAAFGGGEEGGGEEEEPETGPDPADPVGRGRHF